MKQNHGRDRNGTTATALPVIFLYAERTTAAKEAAQPANNVGNQPGIGDAPNKRIPQFRDNPEMWDRSIC